MSRDIGIIVDLATAYGRGVLRGVNEHVRKDRRWNLVPLAATMIDWQRSLDEQLKNMAGAIIQSPIDCGPLKSLAELRLAAVCVADHGERYGMATVRPDHRAVGRMGADFYLGRGFRHLGYVGRSGEPYAQLRYEGFAEAARGRGLDVAAFWIPQAGRGDWGGALGRWLKGLAKPVGILACDDSCARMTAFFSKGQGIAIPEQAALLGVDDDVEACEMDTPHLSSIRTDSQGVGREAMGVLAGMLTGGRRPGKALLVPPIAVTERQSTDTVATEDRMVQEAVRIMRERCRSLQSAAAVARALGLSTQELERRMLGALGRGVAGELRRRRVERAKELLRATDVSLGQVGRECGFRSAASFARDFRQETGVTPSGYRAKAREAGDRRGR